jgi:hypothetical protein
MRALIGCRLLTDCEQTLQLDQILAQSASKPDQARRNMISPRILKWLQRCMINIERQALVNARRRLTWTKSQSRLSVINYLPARRS